MTERLARIHSETIRRSNTSGAERQLTRRLYPEARPSILTLAGLEKFSRAFIVDRTGQKMFPGAESFGQKGLSLAASSQPRHLRSTDPLKATIFKLTGITPDGRPSANGAANTAPSDKLFDKFAGKFDRLIMHRNIALATAAVSVALTILNMVSSLVLAATIPLFAVLGFLGIAGAAIYLVVVSHGLKSAAGKFIYMNAHNAAVLTDKIMELDKTDPAKADYLRNLMNKAQPLVKKEIARAPFEMTEQNGDSGFVSSKTPDYLKTEIVNRRTAREMREKLSSLWGPMSSILFWRIRPAIKDLAEMVFRSENGIRILAGLLHDMDNVKISIKIRKFMAKYLVEVAGPDIGARVANKLAEALQNLSAAETFLKDWEGKSLPRVGDLYELKGQAMLHLEKVKKATVESQPCDRLTKLLRDIDEEIAGREKEMIEAAIRFAEDHYRLDFNRPDVELPAIKGGLSMCVETAVRYASSSTPPMCARLSLPLNDALIKIEEKIMAAEKHRLLEAGGIINDFGCVLEKIKKHQNLSVEDIIGLKREAGRIRSLLTSLPADCVEKKQLEKLLLALQSSGYRGEKDTYYSVGYKPKSGGQGKVEVVKGTKHSHRLALKTLLLEDEMRKCKDDPVEKQIDTLRRFLACFAREYELAGRLKDLPSDLRKHVAFTLDTNMKEIFPNINTFAFKNWAAEEISQSEELLGFCRKHYGNYDLDEVNGKIVIKGKMSEEEKIELQALCSTQEDRDTVESLFQRSQNFFDLQTVKQAVKDKPPLFFVLDFFPKQDGTEEFAPILRQEINKRMSPARLRELFRPLLEVFDWAHKEGICHRDIKPANILITCDKKGEERLVVVDWGMGKDITIQAKITSKGLLAGSPGYMAPYSYIKAAEDDYPAGRYIDIYQMGILFFECLTGKNPTKRKDMTDAEYLGFMMQPGDIDVSDIENRDLAKIIKKMLSKDPANNYQSMSEIIEELSQLQFPDDEKTEVIEAEEEPKTIPLDPQVIKQIKSAEIPKINRKDAVAWWAEGIARKEQGELIEAAEAFNKAIEIFNKILEIDPKNAAVLRDKGAVLYNQGEWILALECSEKALEINPKDAFTWSYRGLALAKLDKLPAAIEAIERALKIDPKNAVALCYKGDILCKQGDLKGALDAFHKAVEINPKDSSPWRDKIAEVLKAFNKAEEIDPNDAVALRKKGNMLHKQGKLPEALEAYKKALSINPNDVDVLSEKGVALAEQGELPEALVIFTKVLEIKPSDVFALGYKGLILEQQGKIIEAAEAFNKAKEIKLKEAVAWRKKGDMFYDQGKLDEALEAYNKAVELDPKDAISWGCRGLTLGRQNKITEALESFYEVIKINPNDAVALGFNKGVVLYKQGKSTEAQEVFNKIGEINNRRR